MTKIICCLVGLAFAAPALAQEKEKEKERSPHQAGAMPDMTKMGPLTRPVTKEDKKGIDDTYKSMEQAWKKGDVEALAEHVDFPVIMLTDDSTGQAKYFSANREQWIALMKPMMGMPKDVQHTHRHTAHFLSDTLAVAIEENSMSGPKMKGKWRGMSVLTLKDGRWKFKEMAEAGWGDMEPPRAAGPSKTPTSTLPIPAPRK